jgi:hypothetical protein
MSDQTTTTSGTDWEARARTAEARVQELTAERARLWEELHQLRAQDREAEHYRAVATYMENTASWKITWPLRAFKTAYIKVRRILEY